MTFLAPDDSDVSAILPGPGEIGVMARDRVARLPAGDGEARAREVGQIEECAQAGTMQIVEGSTAGVLHQGARPVDGVIVAVDRQIEIEQGGDAGQAAE